MPTPPRYEVLNGADAIIDNALRGFAHDAELRELVDWLKVREREQMAVAQVRATWERTKMSPFFKLWMFYVALFVMSICANLIQKKLERRIK
jgi:hypothetical protein